MAKYARLNASSPVDAIRAMLAKMLSQQWVDAVLVAARTPYSKLLMPTLITDPEKVVDADPLAPVAPFNAARQAAALTRRPTGKRLALILRPCEHRALIELVKLKQCALDNVLIVGIECLGRMENEVYLQHVSESSDFTSSFYKNPDLWKEVAAACRICEHFSPKGADLTVRLLADSQSTLGILAGTENGEALINGLKLPTADEPPDQATEIEIRLTERLAARDRVFKQTAEKIRRLETFQTIIATCINCYNCRSACPVCYCKECVFLTDVFAHRPETLLRRALKHGAVKMPTDTTMFHLTRLAHMSHACVGCGHCSSVCPSNIPVADIFRTVAAHTQALFDYQPGRDVSEPIPYLVFEEQKV